MASPEMLNTVDIQIIGLIRALSQLTSRKERQWLRKFHSTTTSHTIVGHYQSRPSCSSFQEDLDLNVDDFRVRYLEAT